MSVNIALKDKISRHFGMRREVLPALYKWKIPENLPEVGFERGNDSAYAANKRLRRFLSVAWLRTPERRTELATWYVKEWGGVHRNGSEKLAAYVSSDAHDLASGPLEGVATWSKILAVRDPDRFAIFDARVSAALNVLHMQCNIGQPLPFKHLRSQNRKVTSFGQKFARAPHSPGASYQSYLELLKSVSAEHSGADFHDVEMLLFCDAENLLDEVMPS